MQPLINKVLPIEQAGFREGRSYCEQVLALTYFVEAGYQKYLKTGSSKIGSQNMTLYGEKDYP